MGAIGTARSVAKLHGSAASLGSEIGLTPTILDQLTNTPTPATGGLRDAILHIDSRYSLGFIRPFPDLYSAPPIRRLERQIRRLVRFTDPDTGTGLAYVMYTMGNHPWSDPRELSLRDNLFHDTHRTLCRTTLLIQDCEGSIA